jgi:pimeloyl-ACP methyl ester carboxylesterase
MRHFLTSDHVEIHFTEVGRGRPVVFAHEFAGDAGSYAAQVGFFARRYRCIAYNARGYPPSGAPASAAAYSQDRACDDLLELLDHLDLAAAHIVGLSMGGFAALHAAMRRPARLASLVIAGSGYGAFPPTRARFINEMEAYATGFLTDGVEPTGRRYAAGPTRVQLLRKDVAAYAEFVEKFLAKPAGTLAATLRGVQRDRPSLWELADRLASIDLPTLIMSGDEDEGCLEPSLFLKRTIRAAGLMVLPNTGHTLNLEEPAIFNAALLDFFHRVETGAWPRRSVPAGAPAAEPT